MQIESLIAVLCLLGQVANAPATNDRATESVEVRYARWQMQLAEANLKRVEQSNKQVARSVPSSVVAEYRHDVDVAKTRLERATAGGAAGDFQVWLQRAAAEQKAAETAWKSAVAANGSAPGTFAPLDIERFRRTRRSREAAIRSGPEVG